MIIRRLTSFIAAFCASLALGQVSVEHTTAGAWDLAISNRGGIGRDSLQAGGTWGRGSADTNGYIADGGFWFGCVRANDPSSQLVELTYSPHRTSAGGGATSFSGLLRKGAVEPVYSSKNYNADGTPRTAGLPPWCVRNVAGGAVLKNGNSGAYVADSAARATLPPVFVADEDIVAAFSDSDYQNAPYPIGLSCVTTLYAWNNDSLRNCVLVKTVVRNTSKDTLAQCFIAPVYGFAIGDSLNDDCAPDIDDSLQLIIAHSPAEQGKRLGAVGLAVINPPRAVPYAGGYAWADYLDPYGDGIRYTMLSQKSVSFASFATVRGLASCGPFTLAPGKSAELVYAIIGGLDTANASVFDSNRVRVLNTLSAVRHFWFSFNVPSAVQDNASVPQQAALSAFPNPFRTQTRIAWPADVTLSRGARVEIVDALGRTVDVRGIADQNATSLDLSSAQLPPGVYHLRLNTGTRILTAPVVVTH